MRIALLFLYTTSILVADDLILDKSYLPEYQPNNFLRLDLPEVSDVRLTIYN